MGSGAGFLDFDLEGDLDILLLDGSKPDLEDRPRETSTTTNSHLYRQGNYGQFTDESGLVCAEFATGIAA